MQEAVIVSNFVFCFGVPKVSDLYVSYRKGNQFLSTSCVHHSSTIYIILSPSLQLVKLYLFIFHTCKWSAGQRSKGNTQSAVYGFLLIGEEKQRVRARTVSCPVNAK